MYDPNGLVAPYTVTALLLLKDIWRLSGQQWDNNLPDDVSEKFLEWAAELPKLSEITIPRSYFRETIENVELHVFGDSSQDVFSAVALHLLVGPLTCVILCLYAVVPSSTLGSDFMFRGFCLC